MLIELLLEERVKVFVFVGSLEELIHYFTLVHLLLDHCLGLLRWQLILLYRLDNLVDTGCPLLSSIIHDASFLYSVETSHDCSLDQANGPIDIVVLNARNQDLFGLFHQVVLYGSYMLNIVDVFVEFWIYGHVLGSNGKSLSMLVLILDIQHKWYASRILGQHLFQESHCEMNALHNQRLVVVVIRLYNLGQLLLNKSTLLLVSFQGYPIIRRILPFLGRHLLTSFISWTEKDFIFTFLEKVPHDMPNGICW